MMNEPIYKYIVVKLTGEDGNAFSIIARVRRALQRADVNKGDIEKFTEEATSGDYDHLVRTVMKWVEVK